MRMSVQKASAWSGGPAKDREKRRPWPNSPICNGCLVRKNQYDCYQGRGTQVLKDMDQWIEFRRHVLTKEMSKRGACKEYDLEWRTLCERRAKERPRVNLCRDRHLSGLAIWPRASSAIPARAVAGRCHHSPVPAVARSPRAACHPERLGTTGRYLRPRMRTYPARPFNRGVTALRLPGPPGQAIPP
jgi:hypothetical protein